MRSGTLARRDRCAILLLMAGFASVIGAGLFAARGTPSVGEGAAASRLHLLGRLGHRLHRHGSHLADRRAGQRLARPGRTARRADRGDHVPRHGRARADLRALEPDRESRLARRAPNGGGDEPRERRRNREHGTFEGFRRPTLPGTSGFGTVVARRDGRAIESRSSGRWPTFVSRAPSPSRSSSVRSRGCSVSP